jgi:hypothetical protein
MGKIQAHVPKYICKEGGEFGCKKESDHYCAILAEVILVD